MSDFEKNNENPVKRVPNRKKTVDVKALALIEDPEDLGESNVSPIRKKDLASYHPDEELLEHTSRIKNQRDLILDRMFKMDQNRERVSKNVFDKVYRDYSMQLDSITHLLDEKKDILKKELKNLYIAFEKKTLDVNRHREILEEAQFRHYLEEFSEEQYKEVEEFESREISTLQSELSQIQSYIRLHEELFDPEDLGLPAAKKQASQSEVTKTVAPVIQKQPVQPAVQKPVQKAEPSINRVEPTIIKPIETQIPELSKEFNQELTPLPELDSLETENEANEISEESIDSDAEIIEPIEAQAEDPIIDYKAESLDPDEKAPYFEASNPSLKMDNSLSQKVEQPIAQTTEEPSQSKVEATPPGKPTENQSIMDILGGISLDEEVSETHSHVANVSSYSVPETSSQESRAVSEFKLVFIEAEGPLDVNEFMVRDNVSIGRSPSNDLVLKAPKVSRQHAAINKYKDQYLLIDLKSSNGVFVNSKKIEEHSLQDGDEVSIGGYKMIFKKS